LGDGLSVVRDAWIRGKGPELFERNFHLNFGTERLGPRQQVVAFDKRLF